MSGLDALLQRWRRRYWKPNIEGTRDHGMKPFVAVTGASEGLGRALAIEFARHGHAVLLIARDGSALASVAGMLRRDHGVEAIALSLDITNSAAATRIEQALRAANGICDVLVNNAAIGACGPFCEEQAGRLDLLIDLNIRALTALTRHFLPGMLARGAGGVLNVASMAGLVPGPHQAAYYASKAYVISLTEAIAEETKGQGVRVATLAPGPVATKFHARMGAEQAYYRRLIGAQSAEHVARAGYRWFRVGRTLIIPGVVPTLSGGALRFLPHMVLVPVIGWLLKRRQVDKDDV